MIISDKTKQEVEFELRNKTLKLEEFLMKYCGKNLSSILVCGEFFHRAIRGMIESKNEHKYKCIDENFVKENEDSREQVEKLFFMCEKILHKTMDMLVNSYCMEKQQQKETDNTHIC